MTRYFGTRRDVALAGPTEGTSAPTGDNRGVVARWLGVPLPYGQYVDLLTRRVRYLNGKLSDADKAIMAYEDGRAQLVRELPNRIRTVDNQERVRRGTATWESLQRDALLGFDRRSADITGSKIAQMREARTSLEELTPADGPGRPHRQVPAVQQLLRQADLLIRGAQARWDRWRISRAFPYDTRNASSWEQYRGQAAQNVQVVAGGQVVRTDAGAMREAVERMWGPDMLPGGPEPESGLGPGGSTPRPPAPRGTPVPWYYWAAGGAALLGVTVIGAKVGLALLMRTPHAQVAKAVVGIKNPKRRSKRKSTKNPSSPPTTEMVGMSPTGEELWTKVIPSDVRYQAVTAGPPGTGRYLGQVFDSGVSWFGIPPNGTDWEQSSTKKDAAEYLAGRQVSCAWK